MYFSKDAFWDAPEQILRIASFKYAYEHHFELEFADLFCLIQDDDYLIRPEIVYALHARLLEPGSPSVIHLAPPQDHLTSALREIRVQHPETSHLSDVHTGFAWLGYGAMLERSQVVKFITMMRELKMLDGEIVMSDNYFSVFGNRVPEVWLDQNFELGGGYPFTVGEEGEQRNLQHLVSLMKAWSVMMTLTCRLAQSDRIPELCSLLS